MTSGAEKIWRLAFYVVATAAAVAVACKTWPLAAFWAMVSPVAFVRGKFWADDQ